MVESNAHSDDIKAILKIVLIELRDQLATQNITINLNAIRKKVDET